MARKLFFSLLSAGLIVGLVSVNHALEKVKLGSSIKMAPQYYLPVLAAEEKGIWKENGLDVEWVPFASTTAHFRGVAAGAVTMGLSASADPPGAAERGLPVILVADLVPSLPMLIWVRADSPYRQFRDLKGTRLGVTALGATSHVLARIIAAALGMEKDVRFVGAGGIPEQMAGLRAGAFESFIASIAPAAGLRQQGIIREVASTADYLPKPWFDFAVFARTDFGRTKPEVLRKALKATLQSTDFMRKTPRWAIDKMKSFQGFSEEAAELVSRNLSFSVTGKIDRKAVENLRKVFIEYAILTEKAPAIDDLFTNEYLP